MQNSKKKTAAGRENLDTRGTHLEVSMGVSRNCLHIETSNFPKTLKRSSDLQKPKGLQSWMRSFRNPTIGSTRSLEICSTRSDRIDDRGTTERYRHRGMLTQSGLVESVINDSSLCPLDPTSRVIALGIRGPHPRSPPSITRFVQLDRIGSMTGVRQNDTDTGVC